MIIPVRVVGVELTQAPDVVARLDGTLPAQERSGPSSARVARAAARALLGECLGVAARDVEISRVCRRCGHPSHGKPTLVNDASVSFSVSHSGGLALVALAAGATVGVDVEELRPRSRLSALAARVLTPAELVEWHAAPEAERLERFLRAWTAKEAHLKATGAGLTTTRLGTVPQPHDGWAVLALAVPAGYVGSLAVDRSDVRVEWAKWEPTVNGSGGTGG